MSWCFYLLRWCYMEYCIHQNTRRRGFYTTVATGSRDEVTDGAKRAEWTSYLGSVGIGYAVHGSPWKYWVDIPGEYGSDIPAMLAWEVIESQIHKDWWWTVVIETEKWFKIRYSHLKYRHVFVWDVVVAWQKIWEMWASGNVLTQCWWTHWRKPSPEEKQKWCWVHLDLTPTNKDWKMLHQKDVEKIVEAIPAREPEWERIWFDQITAYYRIMPWQHRYAWWVSYAQDIRMQGNGMNASGWRYEDHHKYTHGACWAAWKWYILRLDWRPHDIKCVDRWWAIDNNDIDIFYWVWVEALNRIDWRDDRSKQHLHPTSWWVTVLWKF